jgi:hypothetical protein
MNKEYTPSQFDDNPDMFENFVMPGLEAARIEELHDRMNRMSPYLGEAALADRDVAEDE